MMQMTFFECKNEVFIQVAPTLPSVFTVSES